MVKNLIKAGLVSSFGIFLFACGTGDSETSEVSFYLTDKPEMDVEEVNITINKVKFLNTGSGKECTLFEYDPNSEEPNPLENVNLLELADSYLFVNETNCERASYNRLRVDFDREVTIKKEGEIYSCTVEGFDRGSGKQPNRPHCVGNSCYVELNGAVNIAANVEDVGVDFDIKKSKIVIDETTKDCSITFKLSPLHIDKDKLKQKKLKLKGFITDLDTENKEFTFHRKKSDFTVNYQNVLQEGIDNLLTFSYDNRFDRRVFVKVKCSDFEKEIKLCEAEEIITVIKYVQIENLDETNKTFQINLDNNIITVNYTNAEVEGTLQDGAFAKIKLDSASCNDVDGSCTYNALKVEVKEEEME